MEDDDKQERVIERVHFTRMLVALATKAEAAWDQGEVASALLVAHIRYAQSFLSNQDIAAALRKVAADLEPTAPVLPPELLN